MGKKAALFVGGFVAHLVLTLVSVNSMIDCGTGNSCARLDTALDKVVSFPIFWLTELLGHLKPGIHYSGNLMLVLMPINSFVVIAILYLLYRWIVRLRGRGHVSAV
jgi:hypothetical protein